ncbi:DUF2207 domain-containing protein [Fundicoccus ignavus]|nr:DUF2207 domain-containing protein [Fundicoccus ignavus]
MKQLQRWLFVFSLIIVVCSTFVLTAAHQTTNDANQPRTVLAQAEEGKFAITAQDIRAEVEANGSVSFVDTFTYDIKDLTMAEFKLDHEGYEIRNYRVGVLTEDNTEINYLTENYSTQPNTFSAEKISTGTSFKVHYPATNTNIQLVFEYTLEALVANYNDTANLLYKLTNEANQHTYNLTAKILLPTIVTNADNFQVWLHGTQQGEIFETVENNRSIVYLKVDNVNPTQTLEVNAIFPVSLTPNNQNLIEEDRKDQIIAEETSLVDAEIAAFEQKRNRHLMLLMASVVFGPLSVLAAFGYYFLAREKLNPYRTLLPTHTKEIPDATITPAVMAVSMFRAKPTADDFTATIVDLARKGFIELEEVRKEKRGVSADGESSTLKISLGKQHDENDHPVLGATAPLLLHERQVLNYIKAGIQAEAEAAKQDIARQLLSDGGVHVDSVTLEQMEERTKKDKEYRKSQQVYWKKFVDFTELNGSKHRGRKPREAAFARGANILALIISSVMATLGVLVGIEVNVTSLLILAIVVGILSLGAAIFLMILRTRRPILTAEQDFNLQAWQGFGNLLADARKINMRETASIEKWEATIPYAISLGVANQVLAAMHAEYSEDELDTLNLKSSLLTNGYLITGVMQNSISHTLAAIDPGSNVNNYSNTSFHEET